MDFSSETKHYPCPVCGTDAPRTLYRIRGFGIVRCPVCTMVYVDPRVKDERVYEIYRSEYFNRPADGYDNYELNAALRRKTFRRWYDDLRPYLGDSRSHALDIGCAAGYFLDILRDDGWDAQGIELDTTMYESLRSRGHTVSDTPLEFFEPTAKFGLITLFDVLEHLPRIDEHMHKLSDMLAGTGLIALVTPDISSFQKRLMGRRWFQLKPVEHILYFSPKTLAKVVSRHGLRIVHVARSGQYADCMFIHDRLKRYGFGRAAALFNRVVSVLHLRDRHWYADTGSMFVVLKRETARGA